MKIHGGYILQPRSFDKSDAAHLSPVTRELWFYLLRKVNHADSGQYKRGSGFFSFSDIQKDLSWFVGYRKMVYSKPQITKALRRLNEENMTATVKATRGIIITVLNYDDYQTASNYEGNDEGSTKATRRKRQGHTKNKNDKKEELTLEVLFPSHHADPKFVEAWEAWEEYRVELKKPNTDQSRKAQAKKLNALQVAVAISTIETSIANTWQGLFPEKADDKGDRLTLEQRAHRYGYM